MLLEVNLQPLSKANRALTRCSALHNLIVMRQP
jgi:hypothetical protein